MTVKFYWIVVIGWLAGFALSGCSSDPEDLFENAKALEASGEIPSAIIELKSAVQAAPDNAEMRYMLGRLHMTQNNPVQAEKELLKALDLNPANTGEILVELAKAFTYQAKNHELLEQITVESATSESQRSMMHAFRGRAEHRIGDTPAALESLEKAEAFQATNPQIGMLRAQLAVSEGKYDDALAELEVVLEMTPQDLEASMFKATLLNSQARYAEALKAVSSVLLLDEDNFNALLMRARLHLRFNELKAAQRDSSLLIKRYPEAARAHALDGWLKLAAGNPGSALDAARMALRKESNEAFAYLVQGIAHERLNSYELARGSLETYVGLRPGDVYGRRQLANLAMQQGDPEYAYEVLEPIVNSEMDDARSLALAGVAARLLGDTERSLELFERVSRLNPEDTAIPVQQAITKLVGGDAGAFDTLSSTLENRKDASIIDEFLVLGYLKKGNIDRAEQHLTDLESRDPDGAITLNLRGTVLMARYDIAAARAMFERALVADPSFMPAVKNLVQLDIAAGKAERARQRYKKLIEASPRSVNAHTALAELDIGLGHVAEATKTLEAVHRFAPENVGVIADLIRLYLGQNQAQSAVDLSVSGLEKHPNNGTLLQLGAQAQIAIGNKNVANEHALRLANLTPSAASNYVTASKLQVTAGSFASAETTIRKGLKSLRGNSELHVALVSILMKSQGAAAALAYAESVRDEKPKAPFGYILVAEVLEAKGDFAAAASALDQALALQPAGQFAAKKHLAQAKGGDVQGALENLRKWVAQHPNELAAKMHLANVLMDQGEFKEAIKHFETIMAADAMTINALNSLAWAYYKTGDDRAVSMAETAYRVGPNIAVVVDTLGWILVEKGEVNRGVTFLRRASVLGPELAEIQYHLGAALLLAGEKKAAISALEKAAKSEGNPTGKAEAQGLLDKT